MVRVPFTSVPPVRSTERASIAYLIDWMMVWLSQHPAWTKARKLAVSTSTFGLVTALDDYGNPKSGRKARFIVAYDHVSTFWFKRRYVEAVRSKPEGLSYRAARSLRLR